MNKLHQCCINFIDTVVNETQPIVQYYGSYQ